jgi:hypothetical protein
MGSAGKRGRRRRLLLAAWLTQLGLLAWAMAGPPPAAAQVTHELPPQGVYEACAPGASAAALAPCLQRLQEIRDGGFTVVLNYAGLYGTPDQVRVYAAAAAALGIRLIWPLHHPTLRRAADVSTTFPQMARACGCSSPRELVAYLIGVVRDLPATWMYYVGDEVAAAEHDAAKAISALVGAADPAHARFIVGYGNDGTGVAPFIDTADVLATDYYPLYPGTGGGADMATAAQAAQLVSGAAAKPMAMVLQAFSWGPSYKPIAQRWPTVAEYTAMRDATLDHSDPLLILWWAYYVIKREPEAELHWRQLVAGAMGPQADPAPTRGATVAPAHASGDIAARFAEVRTLSATVRRRVSRVRFALSARSPVSILVRCARRRAGGRRVMGGRRVRIVHVKVRRGHRACRVTVTPVGGKPRTVAPLRTAAR